MHLHQPDWKSGVRTEDGGVHTRHHAEGADAPYRRLTYRS